MSLSKRDSDFSIFFLFSAPGPVSHRGHAGRTFKFNTMRAFYTSVPLKSNVMVFFLIREPSLLQPFQGPREPAELRS